MAKTSIFTDREITLIVGSLPAGIPKRRLKLIPKILRDWCKEELPKDLFEESTKIKRARVKRLKAVDVYAKKLLEALDAIDQKCEQLLIVREMVIAAESSLNPSEIARQENQLNKTRGTLKRLSSASAESTKLWMQGRGQPRNEPASLVLMDIVAIYEWLTGKKATRRLDSVTSEDAGPFWNFAAAIWPPVFHNGDYGLSAAIRNWDGARKKKLKGTRSPLLANIAIRHPDWGIFEP